MSSRALKFDNYGVFKKANKFIQNLRIVIKYMKNIEKVKQY